MAYMVTPSSLFTGRRLITSQAVSSLHLRSTNYVIKAAIREIFMPVLSSTMTEGKILTWSKSEGDRVRKGDTIVVLEVDKAEMAIATFYDGYLAHVAVSEGEVAPIGAVIALLGETKEEIAQAKRKTASSSDATDIRRMSLASLQRLYSDIPISELMTDPFDGTLLRPGDKPFTALQTLISEYMVETLSVPTFRVGYTITTTALDQLYRRLKCKGVTMTALLVKATALALAQHPVINASCKDGKNISYNSSIDIAVVVAIDGGLITPVLQNADKIDIFQLARKWNELVNKARTKQLQISEFLGETFTISNMGMFGVDRFDGGQSGIMAVGSSKPTVVASNDGSFKIVNQMQVNVTADHRIIDEADLAAFLQTLARIIEDPKDLIR